MKAKHWLALFGSIVVPLLAAFFSNWDGKVTSASIVAAMIAALNIWMQRPDIPTKPPGLTGAALLLCLGVSVGGCLKAVPVIGPTVSCVASVVADALKGMTLDQILADAGPQCVQSIDQIIAILVGEGARNPMVRETVAYRDQRTGAWLRASQGGTP